jgi:hypothetical protein
MPSLEHRLEQLERALGTQDPDVINFGPGRLRQRPIGAYSGLEEL